MGHPPASPFVQQLRLFSLWLSLIHALEVLALVPLAIASQVDDVSTAETWHEWAYDTMQRLTLTEPNNIHKFISGFAGAYYIFDLVLTVSRRTDDTAHARATDAREEWRGRAAHRDIRMRSPFTHSAYMHLYEE
jgi:hypothetical protein